jgi:hypothetical protein
MRRPYCGLCGGAPAGIVRVKRVLEVTPGHFDDDGWHFVSDDYVYDYEDLEPTVSFRCARHRQVKVTDANLEVDHDDPYRLGYAAFERADIAAMNGTSNVPACPDES